MVKLMTKIRCGDNTGIDLDQVIAWRKTQRSTGKEETLTLFFAGADDGFYVSQNSVGCQAFAYLHKLLLDLFAIDLAGENNLKKETIDDYAGEAVLDRYIDPEELNIDR